MIIIEEMLQSKQGKAIGDKVPIAFYLLKLSIKIGYN